MDGLSKPDNAAASSTLPPDRQSDSQLRETLKSTIERFLNHWASEYIQRNPLLPTGSGLPALGFSWHFSKSYPRFPGQTSFVKGSPIPENLSTWKREDVVCCLQALITSNLKIAISGRIISAQDHYPAPGSSPRRGVTLEGRDSSQMAGIAAVMNSVPTSRQPTMASHPLLGSSPQTVNPNVTANGEASTESNHKTDDDLPGAAENMGISRERERLEQTLRKTLDASEEKCRSLEAEKRALMNEVKSLQEDLKSDRAYRAHGEEINDCLGGSSARIVQREKTAASLSTRDIHGPRNASTHGTGIQENRSGLEEADEIQGFANIHERIKALRRPSDSSLPKQMYAITMDFVQQHVGGDYSLVTSTNPVDDPKVEWRQVHVDPKFHKDCPRRLMMSGALVHIVGCPTAGKIGQTYALWRKESEKHTKYIGHFKVMEKILMPPEVWQQEFSADKRTAIVNNLLNHHWGYHLLHSKGIDIRVFETYETKHKRIVELFEAENEPCLRMFWSVLQFESYELADHNKLLRAVRSRGGGEDEPEFVGYGRDLMGLGPPDTKSEDDVALPSRKRGEGGSLSSTSSNKRPEPHDESEQPATTWTTRRLRTRRASRAVVYEEADAMDVSEDSSSSPVDPQEISESQDLPESQEVVSSQYVMESENVSFSQ